MGKVLAMQDEDQGSEAQNSHNKLGMMAHVYHPSTGEVETGGSLGLVQLNWWFPGSMAGSVLRRMMRKRRRKMMMRRKLLEDHQDNSSG